MGEHIKNVVVMVAVYFILNGAIRTRVRATDRLLTFVHCFAIVAVTAKDASRALFHFDELEQSSQNMLCIDIECAFAIVKLVTGWHGISIENKVGSMIFAAFTIPIHVYLPLYSFLGTIYFVAAGLQGIECVLIFMSQNGTGWVRYDFKEHRKDATLLVRIVLAIAYVSQSPGTWSIYTLLSLFVA